MKNELKELVESQNKIRIRLIRIIKTENAKLTHISKETKVYYTILKLFVWEDYDLRYSQLIKIEKWLESKENILPQA